MHFELAKKTSYYLHRALLTFINLGPALYLKPLYEYTTYLEWFAIFLTTWIISIFLFKGCIFTKIENYFAVKFYGKPFYPDYDITKSIPYEFVMKFKSKTN